MPQPSRPFTTTTNAVASPAADPHRASIAQLLRLPPRRPLPSPRLRPSRHGRCRSSPVQPHDPPQLLHLLLLHRLPPQALARPVRHLGDRPRRPADRSRRHLVAAARCRLRAVRSRRLPEVSGRLLRAERAPAATPPGPARVVASAPAPAVRVARAPARAVRVRPAGPAVHVPVGSVHSDPAAASVARAPGRWPRWRPRCRSRWSTTWRWRPTPQRPTSRPTQEESCSSSS